MTTEVVFTVITPVYNCEEYISETIASVLNFASDFKFEYIVVNDGSSDRSLEIINTFAERIVIIDQSNSGEASAINKALEIAKAKYCLIVSADDPLCSKELFKKAYDILEAHLDVVVAYPDWSMIDGHGKVLAEIVTEEYSEDTLVGKFKCIPGPGAVFRTEIAKKVGGRNTSYKFVSDYDFWLKLSRNGSFRRIPLFLAQWRHHENSTSIKLRGFTMANERILVIDNFIKSNELDPNLVKSAIAYSYYHAAMLAYFNREIPGRNWIMKSFRVYRGWIPGAKVRVVLYLLLFPSSYHLVQVLNRSKLGSFLPKG
jgi:glycosyltransferase involved in cell wall biosynthesis